eukprot:TRINITY_DN95441_c0_g1_i1.p1 TRINITY_DN95441_c0_g1~~TRINITY_DN95441_c0_g1_i1.p1  ORF type:complete len:242 (+),score=67.32 TRINITY_DN95441_c0_g1_i1:52-726(+)
MSLAGVSSVRPWLLLVKASVLRLALAARPLHLDLDLDAAAAAAHQAAVPSAAHSSSLAELAARREATQPYPQHGDHHLDDEGEAAADANPLPAEVEDEEPAEEGGDERQPVKSSRLFGEFEGSEGAQLAREADKSREQRLASSAASLEQALQEVETPLKEADDLADKTSQHVNSWVKVPKSIAMRIQDAEKAAARVSKYVADEHARVREAVREPPATALKWRSS